MREGSTSLGSLGVIPSGIAMLMLPFSLAVLGVFSTPKPARSAERAPMLARQTDAVRAALQRRAQWIKSGRAASTNGVAKRAGEVVKTIRTHATWYGPGFHGRRTASGERFNRNAMTLASRHLPMGTRVRVTNPRNGRSVLARVNDRGPFGHRHVTADLSQALAKRIGLGGRGPVRLEILRRAGAAP